MKNQSVQDDQSFNFQDTASIKAVSSVTAGIGRFMARNAGATNTVQTEGDLQNDAQSYLQKREVSQKKLRDMAAIDSKRAQ